MKNPWDKDKTVTHVSDVRRILAFITKGRDKCPNLLCLGKVQFGIEKCPHCEIGLFWFDEPDPEGWA